MAKRNKAKTTQDTLPITYIVDEASLSMTFDEAMAGLHPLIHLLARQAAREWSNQTYVEKGRPKQDEGA